VTHCRRVAPGSIAEEAHVPTRRHIPAGAVAQSILHPHTRPIRLACIARQELRCRIAADPPIGIWQQRHFVTSIKALLRGISACPCFALLIVDYHLHLYQSNICHKLPAGACALVIWRQASRRQAVARAWLQGVPGATSIPVYWAVDCEGC
jgi:hypothetical protein